MTSILNQQQILFSFVFPAFFDVFVSFLAMILLRHDFIVIKNIRTLHFPDISIPTGLTLYFVLI